jgi:hypothetical protein
MGTIEVTSRVGTQFALRRLICTQHLGASRACATVAHSRFVGSARPSCLDDGQTGSYQLGRWVSTDKRPCVDLIERQLPARREKTIQKRGSRRTECQPCSIGTYFLQPDFWPGLASEYVRRELDVL